MDEITSRLNKVSLDLIMLEKGDLIGISNIISVMEEILELAKYKLNEQIIKILETLIQILQCLINNQIEEYNEFITIFSDGINILQSALSEDSDHLIDEPQYTNLIQRLSSLLPDGAPVNHVKKEQKQVDLSDDLDLYNNFILESTEHLDNVEANILILENNPKHKESLDIIFRAFHTIKGVSGFLNLDDINFLAHETESLLEYIINHNVEASSKFLDLFLEHNDLMKMLLSNLKMQLDGEASQEIQVNRNDILKNIKNLIERNDSKEDKGDAYRKEVDATKTINVTIPETDEKKPIKSEIINSGSNGGKSSSTNLTGIKVNAQKLDNLLDMVGELVIAYTQTSQNRIIKESTNDKLLKDIVQLKRVVGDLQRLSMSLRMMEIKQTFQKLTRLVRDLSKKSNKPIDLKIFGEDTEIDRSIVDEIYEPLVHLLRNAIDHGIEPQEERQKKNKNVIGTISLSAYHQGGNIIIEIADDGKGLDKQKIIKKAIEKGLLPETEDFEHITEEEIYRLIFLPGFSTAKEVTDVSGRGVGMDIVREKIHSLRGTIELFSEVDKGTKFCVKIPLTMAIIDGMVVVVGECRYILPTLNVRQILKLDKNKYFTYKKQGEMVDIRGNLLPLIRLHRVMNVFTEHTEVDDALIIVVESNNQQKCILVDEILDKQEIVVKSLGDSLKDIKGVAAGTILGDGKVGLILDVEGIFRLQNDYKYEINNGNKLVEDKNVE